MATENGSSGSLLLFASILCSILLGLYLSGKLRKYKRGVAPCLGAALLAFTLWFGFSHSDAFYCNELITVTSVGLACGLLSRPALPKGSSEEEGQLKYWNAIGRTQVLLTLLYKLRMSGCTLEGFDVHEDRVGGTVSYKIEGNEANIGWFNENVTCSANDDDLDLSKACLSLLEQLNKSGLRAKNLFEKSDGRGRELILAVRNGQGKESLLRARVEPAARFA